MVICRCFTHSTETILWEKKDEKRFRHFFVIGNDRNEWLQDIGRSRAINMDEQEILNRWRLVLGKYAAEQISFSGDGLKFMDMEQVLDYLYEREYGEDQDIRKEHGGGSGDSALTVPDWLWKIKKLFPRQTVEIMERHALEKYQMTELLTDPEVLKKLEPNKELLKTILSLKHMMKGRSFRLQGSLCARWPRS